MKTLKDVVDIISKIALPFAIAIFGWVQYQTSFDFERNKSDKELMLKFIEIAWNSLNSQDTTEIRNSVKLLGMIDPKYSYQLLAVLSEDTVKYGFLENEIEKVKASVENVIIDKLAIEIDYTAYECQEIADEIKSRLMSETRLGYNDIKTYSKYRVKGVVCRNEIMYSEETDFQKVKALQNFLNSNLKSDMYFFLKQNASIKEDTILVRLC